MTFRTLQKVLTWIIIGIFLITILEFPAPIGFETRPQDNVSIVWLFLFLAILVTEVATLVLIRTHHKLGAKIGMIAATLNIVQIIADQTHMMQPEVASSGYLLLEDSVGALSLFLFFISWKILFKPRTE